MSTDEYHKVEAGMVSFFLIVTIPAVTAYEYAVVSQVLAPVGTEIFPDLKWL